MKFKPMLFAAVAAFGFAGSAMAQDEAGIKLTGEIGVVSDYRYRGLSLSGEDPAIQGGLTLELPQGFYAGVWGSNIEDTDGADIEVDLLAGYAFSAGGFDFDVGAVYYAYPGGDDLNYWEIPVSVSKSFDAFTGTVGLAYAPEQDNLGNQDNTYFSVSGEYAPESWPVSLDGWIGYEDGAFADGKTDWALGVTKEFGPIGLSLHYVDSDVDSGAAVVGLKASF